MKYVGSEDSRPNCLVVLYLNQAAAWNRLMKTPNYDHDP
jgi:hypothetical protein